MHKLAETLCTCRNKQRVGNDAQDPSAASTKSVFCDALSKWPPPCSRPQVLCGVWGGVVCAREDAREGGLGRGERVREQKRKREEERQSLVQLECKRVFV